MYILFVCTNNTYKMEQEFFEKKIWKDGNSFVLTIPKDVMLKYRWKEGKKVILRPNGNGILVYEEKEPSFLKGKNIIYTIGYEGMTINEFIKTLKENKIKQIIDVRDIAFSRKNGFSKAILKSMLNNAGIKYRHFPQMGAPKAIRKKLSQDRNYKRFFELYEKYITQYSKKETLELIIDLAKGQRTAIMCYEADMAICHRNIIAKNIKDEGFEVISL